MRFASGKTSNYTARTRVVWKNLCQFAGLPSIVRWLSENLGGMISQPRALATLKGDMA